MALSGTVPVVARTKLPDLSLTEWAVLAVVAEQPTHGFAIAKELGAEGDLGQIWTVRRPIVYRTLSLLEEQKLIQPLAAEPGNRGPTRTRMRATRAGKAAVATWLQTPASHVRDLRTQLLLQFKYLDRLGLDLQPLARAQLDLLTPIAGGLRGRAETTMGNDGLLARWRYESVEAAMRVLQGIVADATKPA